MEAMSDVLETSNSFDEFRNKMLDAIEQTQR